MEFIKNINDVYKYYNKKLDDKKNIIQTALAASSDMMTLEGFIKVTNFVLPDTAELSMIQQYKADIPILLTEKLIASFGYKGENKAQKRLLRDKIKSSNIPYIQLNNTQYREFIDTDNELRNLYPEIKISHGMNNLIHILIMPEDLKKLMMTMNTARGSVVRDCYLKIEELLKLYLEYQCTFHKQSYSNILNNIHSMPQNLEHMKQSKLSILDAELKDRQRVGVIYFICEENDTAIAKIGYTYNLCDRLRQLQTANRRTLIVLKYYFM